MQNLSGLSGRNIEMQIHLDLMATNVRFTKNATWHRVEIYMDSRLLISFKEHSLYIHGDNSRKWFAQIPSRPLIIQIVVSAVLTFGESKTTEHSARAKIRCKKILTPRKVDEVILRNKLLGGLAFHI